MMSQAELTALIEHEFPLHPEVIYLNHAGIGPWPRRAANAVIAFAEESVSAGARNYTAWLKTESRLRSLLAQLINAESSDDIALLKNTSEGLSFVAGGLDWVAGDVVVVSDEEFPSNRIVWEALAERGVTLRRAALRTPGRTPEAALMAACDARTRVMSVSAVQYASGLRLDVAALGAFCRAHRIWLCVDAIQQLGALPFDAQAARADFVVADGHKWMLGPEGVAVFYVRPDLRERLHLLEFGWHMTDRPGDYERLEWLPHPSARRFECGSPNLLGIHALAASVELLLQIGIPQVSALLMRNMSYLLDILSSIRELEVVSDTAPERCSGILTVRTATLPAARVHEFLRRKGVICAVRSGLLRFAPHFYTRRAQLDQVGELLVQALGRA